MSTITEQRNKPRVDFDYPANVEGIDQQGKTYKGIAKLSNLCAGGVYMWVNRVSEHGSKLSVAVLMSSIPIGMGIPKLAMKGIVVANRTTNEWDLWRYSYVLIF